MLIRDVLTVKGDCANFAIDPDAGAAKAVARMIEYDIGSLLVMADGALVGLVTERMILRGLGDRPLAAAKVGELMAREPLTANLDDSVDYAREVMTKHHISHLIIMDDAKLVGVISFHDVAKACLKETQFENTLLKRYIKNWPE